MRYTFALIGVAMATPAAAQNINIVTDMPVTHSLVSMVLGETGSADLLLDQGGDPHNFQLRPSQARALSQADLLFWVSSDLTPWLDRAITGTGIAGEAVKLMDVPGIQILEYAFGHGHDHDDHGHDDHGHDDHGHDHDDHGHDDHGHAHDDHGHDDHGHDHDDHGHDDHDHGHSHDGIDPHAWMNTANAALWVDAIADALSARDPDNAATYAANAQAARTEIAALADEVATLLEPVADAPLVMFHDAYGYLSDQFGVNVTGTIALGDAAAPGAQRLAELRAQLAEQGAVCIFPEVNHSSRYADLVIEGTDVRLGAEIDPEGVMLDPGAGLYGALMRNMAQAIADCVAG